MRVTVRFCVPCGRRDAIHFNGKCAMSHTHPVATCACGRHAPSGTCSACEAAKALR